MLEHPVGARMGASIQACRTRLAETSPGFLVAVTIALASTFISDHYGGPTLLYALLFGMALHFLSQDGRAVPGINFTARVVLRAGVALLGARITAGQIAALGWETVACVLAGVGSTILCGWLLARLLGIERNFGLLSGGSVAICGASAAMALSAAMPRGQHGERNLILTVALVTTLSTVAMILYPPVATALGLTHAQAGVFLGATIHDVAQVVGAGYMISVETGDTSTIVKLVRVALLAPVVMCFMIGFQRRTGSGSGFRVPMPPGFLLAFLALVLVNSAGLMPAPVAHGLAEVSRWSLVAAIGALGVKTSMRELVAVGWRPVAVVVGETLFLAALILTAILGLGVAG